MAYEAEISYTNNRPGYLVFLIDQSKSMESTYAGTNKTLAQGLADVLNKILDDLVTLCAKEDEPRNYFDISVIGYTGTQSGENMIGPALKGVLKKDVISISELADNPLRLEPFTVTFQGGEKRTSQRPVWIEPFTEYTTPMCAALDYAINVVGSWIYSGHERCFPPIVINITDGQSTDGDPRINAARLKDLRTDDGNVLLMNCHLTYAKCDPAVLPACDGDLPQGEKEMIYFSRILFQMSSVLPDKMAEIARNEMKLPVNENAVCMVCNADMSMVFDFINIGTRFGTKQLRT